jgi:pyrimidine deaminase RibD-like protein
LNKLCEMVVKGQKSDKDYGMVAACVLDPDNNIVAGLNMPSKDGKRIHAERVAVEKYEKKYGEVPEGSIVITTLSPCNESDDETAEGREGESCTDYLNSKGIKKVYCGYIDPTQDNDQREFNLLETSDKSIREECKKFADTFLDDESKQKVDESSSGYIPSNAEKDDPRYKTALTVDIKPDTMMKNAKKLGSKISRAGIPPTLKASGKF